MNNVKLPIFILFALLLLSCKQEQKPELEKNPNNGPFFGIVPTEQPQLLAPELLTSPVTEYNGTFSPDGKEFYYTTDVPQNAYITFTEMLSDSTWSEPKIASFSGEFSDYDPLFSPDGNRIYFSSSRPKGDNENSKIWYVERTDTGWGEPIRVMLTGEEDNEFYSSLTHDGTLYFNIWSKGDIYKATPTDSIYQVELLPEIINDGGDKGDPFISPNEDYLIFRGYDDSIGRGDLYITFNINGEWTSPENLGEPINSETHEMCPWVSQDGKLFVFASGRSTEKLQTAPLDPIKKVQEVNSSYNNLNLYYTSTDFIQKMKQKHLD
ncbi:TolB family protein [Flagellimonas sp.]|uniref:TolB family protein n=1 Tax=Flagellimonas sp. TaxID=2058762 RepID=UPI003B5B8E11